MSVARRVVSPALVLFLAACAAPTLGPGDGAAEIEIHPDLRLSKFDGSPPPRGKQGQFGPESRIWSVSSGRHEIEVTSGGMTDLGGGRMRMSFSTSNLKFEAKAGHRYFITTGVVGQTLKSDGRVRVVDRTERTCWYAGDQPPTPCGEGRPSWAPKN